ncbi:MAG: PIN domain-containing protein [Methylovulum sp.]|nr:PIN domain-containing protein [Methylovulum sp.]
MIVSVLLDTSFLISLSDRTRPNHLVASHYYRYLLEQGIPIYFSAIVAAEFAIKEDIADLPLRNFRVLPFNITHSREAARIWNLLVKHDDGDNRVVVKDDVKIIAQAVHEKIPLILTEDAKTFYKYCERLRTSHQLNIRAIKLVDGFDPSALRLDGQTDIEGFSE